LTEDGAGGGCDAEKKSLNIFFSSDVRRDHDLEELGWRCSVFHG
jgi:hypothetical protein